MSDDCTEFFTQWEVSKWLCLGLFFESLSALRFQQLAIKKEFTVVSQIQELGSFGEKRYPQITQISQRKKGWQAFRQAQGKPGDAGRSHSVEIVNFSLEA